MKKEIKLVFEKETTGTYRYKETADEITVGTLYIKKSVFTEKRPDEITVTIESKVE